MVIGGTLRSNSRQGSAGRFPSLDIGVRTGLYHGSVGNFVKVALILIVVVAVATILVTPDPKDDVPGVLHKAQVYGLSLSSAVLQPLAVSPARAMAHLVPFYQPDSSGLLDLVCVRLC
jgi:hypothetical protein